MSSLRVLVVEDSVLFCQFIRSTLAERPDAQVIGEVADGLEAVHKAQLLKPDLILLDIGLPTLNGIEAAHRILRLVPDAKILFVSQESDADVVAAAIGNGAKGYVLKQDAGIDLVPAVEAVLRGAHFVSTGVAKSHATSPLN